MEGDKVSAHEKAVEAAIIAGARCYDEGVADWDEQYRAAISAYLASLKESGFVVVPKMATYEVCEAMYTAMFEGSFSPEDFPVFQYGWAAALNVATATEQEE